MATSLHQFLVPVGFRRDGRPIYPIRGGSEPPAPPAPTPAPVPTPPAATPPAPPDKGFPDNTPLEQMNAEQREAYWRHYARQHEGRVRALGGLTPEQLAELKEKAARADALSDELATDSEKAVNAAKRDTQAAADAKYQPLLVQAHFRAELKGRVPDEELDARLATITEPLDLTKFLTADGQADTAKVTAFINGIAPGTGTPAPSPTPPPRGPSPSGLGQRPGSSASPSVASGRELYAAKHRSRSSA
jgi:hypothetical protein